MNEFNRQSPLSFCAPALQLVLYIHRLASFASFMYAKTKVITDLMSFKNKVYFYIITHQLQ